MTADFQASILQLIDAYKRAVHDKDTDAFMAMYDEGARVFDTWRVWSYEGPDTRRRMVADWFASLGSDRVQVSVDDMRVIEGQAMGGMGLCVVTAAFRYAAVSAAGSELRAMHNRLTWAVSRHGKSWKIVHEHTSVPIGADDGKAIFQRETA